jgi:hypothetical protein
MQGPHGVDAETRVAVGPIDRALLLELATRPGPDQTKHNESTESANDGQQKGVYEAADTTTIPLNQVVAIVLIGEREVQCGSRSEARPAVSLREARFDLVEPLGQECTKTSRNQEST